MIRSRDKQGRETMTNWGTITLIGGLLLVLLAFALAGKINVVFVLVIQWTGLIMTVVGMGLFFVLGVKYYPHLFSIPPPRTVKPPLSTISPRQRYYQICPVCQGLAVFPQPTCPTCNHPINWSSHTQ